MSTAADLAKFPRRTPRWWAAFDAHDLATEGAATDEECAAAASAACLAWSEAPCGFAWYSRARDEHVTCVIPNSRKHHPHHVDASGLRY